MKIAYIYIWYLTLSPVDVRLSFFTINLITSKSVKTRQLQLASFANISTKDYPKKFVSVTKISSIPVAPQENKSMQAC